MKATGKRPKFRTTIITLTLFLVAVLAAACSEAEAGGAFPVEGSYEVDPHFREFYDYLGGQPVLGAAISPLIDENGVGMQYTEAALMVYDLQAPADQRFQLAPLGLKLGVSEPEIQPPADSKGRFLDGHIIFSEFEPIYDRLGGSPVLGRPLTEVHYNPDKGRYEQYFEKVGFYRLEGEAPGIAHLLAYGVWECSSTCRNSSPLNSTISVPPQSAPLFDQTVQRLGQDFTGLPLSDVYTAWDGQVEQIFENLVLISSADGQVSLRAVLEVIGIYPDPLGVASNDPLMYFFALQGDQGYNVPRFFLEYINQHGGFELIGSPIGELSRYSDQVYRQCFQRLCLDYDQTLPSPVRPAPIGITYRQITLPETTGAVTTNVEVATPPVHEVIAEMPAENSQTALDIVLDEPAIPTAETINLNQTAPEATQENIEPVPPAPAADPNLFPDSGGNFPEIRSLNEISLQVWEANPMVASDQGQDVGVGIMVNSVPIANLEPVLIVTLPDGSEQTHTFTPTGGDGQSRLIIPAISASNGTLIPYQVCLMAPQIGKFCVKDSYLIWNP